VPLRGSEIARSQLASREEAWQVPVVYLHCNDLRSEHRFTRKLRAEPQARNSASTPLQEWTLSPKSPVSRRILGRQAPRPDLIEKSSFPGGQKSLERPKASLEQRRAEISFPKEPRDQNHLAIAQGVAST